MKLTDFLQDVGRPVAYYPELRKITGSVTATILLCQFIYWRGKESSGDGWLYKTADDIQNETGLSYGEQKTARRDLVAAGLLDEHYARLDHQMRFKVNLDAINDKWGNEVSDIPESGKLQFGNDAKPLSLNESENTAETTSNGDFPFDMQEVISEANAAMDKHLDVELFNAPGIKAEARRNSILSYLGERLHVNTETKAWREFAKYADGQQQKGEKIEVFIAWLLGQDKFQIQYWPPRRMMEMWPQAFVKVESNNSVLPQFQKVTAPTEEVAVPNPFKRRK